MPTKADFQAMVDWCSQGVITDPYGNKGLCVILPSLHEASLDPSYHWEGALQFSTKTSPVFTEYFSGVLSSAYYSPTLSLMLAATDSDAWAYVNGSNDIGIDEVVQLSPNGCRLKFSTYTCFCSLGLVSPDFVQPEPVVIVVKPEPPKGPKPPTGLTSSIT